MKTISMKRQDIYKGNLILVNRKYPYHEEKKENLIPVPGEGSQVFLNRRAAALLSNLMEKIAGWQEIIPVSGWRSLEEQKKIWDTSLLESGQSFTEKYVAVPGHSEHQTGLAIDLGLRAEEIDFIRPDFPYQGICGRFRDNAADFGFVERYPKGKEEITGIGHEPWHFRYVGMPHAALMKERDMTLEEYTDFIRQYPYGSRPLEYQKKGLRLFVSYLKADAGENTELTVSQELPYSISGNNVDGFIVTEWRRDG